MIGQLHAVSGLVLAQASRWESLGDGVRNKGQAYSLTQLLLGSGAMVAVIAAIWFVLQRFTEGKRRRTNNPRKLFRELCAAHGLDRKDRRLLTQVTHWQRLAHPARLFLEPERFEPVNLSPALQKQQERLTTIRARLFAQPTPAEPTASA